MKTRTLRNALTDVLPFFALALFSMTTSVSQGPTRHSNGKIAFSQEISVMNADGSRRRLNPETAGVQPRFRADAVYRGRFAPQLFNNRIIGYVRESGRYPRVSK